MNELKVWERMARLGLTLVAGAGFRVYLIACHFLPIALQRPGLGVVRRAVLEMAREMDPLAEYPLVAWVELSMEGYFEEHGLPDTVEMAGLRMTECQERARMLREYQARDMEPSCN